MESVHCYRCYRFPSKNLDFYITNCMHIFCIDCNQLCQPSHPSSDPKCIECKLQPCRILKMSPSMPNQVKQMFTPLREDIAQSIKDLTRVVTFQQRQRHNFISGMTRKLKYFDKLRDAHNEEKKKKDNYKKQLEHAYRIIQSKESEIMYLKQEKFDRSRKEQQNNRKSASPPKKSTAETMTTPSMVRVFSDSMYQTPRQMKEQKERKQQERKIQEIPPFCR
ncbi:hypothetical protein CAEBREN_23298 [Caenorhabditis brenneri]|uniref:RING-type domain-containing protein n=1 Tax=Caenorhabditis brenneri TaxID=135651 RepID=G0N3A3_CAEBE|nr:hypothetical protein CAEBREN_23298 [Caenorhabditis brenneri]